MSIVSLDTETCLIRPGLLAPPLVCASVADATNSYELYHHTEARPLVEALLESDVTIVGDNVAFDFSVICAKWPDLMPRVFEVYWADRVSDTEIREKLNHIATGMYRGFKTIDGKTEKLNYALADIARRRLKIELEKGTWQLRFGELIDTPLADWPEEARDYAIGDAVVTLAVWQDQQQEEESEISAERPRFFEDEFRQSRAAWWLQLMACWGMITNPEGVRAFARQTQQKYDAIAEDLEAAGLLRSDGTRNVKAVKDRVVAAYLKRARDELGVSEKALVETKLIIDGKDVRTVISLNGKEAKTFIEMTPGGKTGKHQPKTDADVCEHSGDEVLQNYAELSSLKKTFSTDIPLLERAVRVPLKVHYDSLLATGRTSSSPNVQNLPTEVGVRECFCPRPGWIYATADYSGFELRTWSQVCITRLGQSRMAEVLRAGVDPHIELACRIMGISYEEAALDYKRDPKGRVYHPRQASKAANFGFPGGLGVKRWRAYARKNYGVSVTPEKSEEIKQFWFDSWPESKLYFEWVADRCEDIFPLFQQLGSNRYRGDVKFTEAANSMFQGLAADAAKAAGFLIARACYVDESSQLFGCRPVNFVHDEFIVEVPDNDGAHDAAVELARLMVVGASGFLPDVPPVAEPMLTRTWSKKAKPVRDASGRLVPWVFPVEEAA
jgi:hypothetical protein